MESLSDRQRALLNADMSFVQITFENEGGLIMPIILRVEFADQTDTVVRIPAEIWLKAETEVTKVFPFEKEVVQIELDPFLETADTDLSDNYWPARRQPSRVELFRRRTREPQSNPMQRQ